MMTKLNFSSVLFCLVLLGNLFFSGCDPERKKKCEWYLMPEPSLSGTTDAGYIPVCARNLTNNKQYCKLQAELEFSKRIYGKKFRYSEMKIDDEGRFPKKIISIDPCE